MARSPILAPCARTIPRPIGAAVVRDEDLSGHSFPSEERLGLANARSDGFSLIEARHKDSQLQVGRPNEPNVAFPRPGNSYSALAASGRRRATATATNRDQSQSGSAIDRGRPSNLRHLCVSADSPLRQVGFPAETDVEPLCSQPLVQVFDGCRAGDSAFAGSKTSLRRCG